MGKSTSAAAAAVATPSSAARAPDSAGSRTEKLRVFTVPGAARELRLSVGAIHGAIAAGELKLVSPDRLEVVSGGSEFARLIEARDLAEYRALRDERNRLTPRRGRPPSSLAPAAA